jgi:hypothetical protein
LGVESLPVLARPADLCMSNLVAKSGLDIFWRQDPVGLSQAHESAKTTGCTPLGCGHSAGTGDWQSSKNGRVSPAQTAATGGKR